MPAQVEAGPPLELKELDRGVDAVLRDAGVAEVWWDVRGIVRDPSLRVLCR